MMYVSQKRENPGWRSGASQGAVVECLPRNSAEVAARLQRRLSAFGLVTEGLVRDVDTVQTIVEKLYAGFSVTDAERKELAAIALRLFDAREVLGD